MALITEEWRLLKRDKDSAQITRTQGETFITVWKLQLTDDWRVESVFMSDQEVRKFPRGLRLTCNRIDTILRSFVVDGEFPNGA